MAGTLRGCIYLYTYIWCRLYLSFSFVMFTRRINLARIAARRSPGVVVGEDDSDFLRIVLTARLFSSRTCTYIHIYGEASPPIRKRKNRVLFSPHVKRAASARIYYAPRDRARRRASNYTGSANYGNAVVSLNSLLICMWIRSLPGD